MEQKELILKEKIKFKVDKSINQLMDRGFDKKEAMYILLLAISENYVLLTDNKNINNEE